MFRTYIDQFLRYFQISNFSGRSIESLSIPLHEFNIFYNTNQLLSFQGISYPYLLNFVGDYDNPSRHTMFVPVDTSGFNIDLNTPNNLGEETLPGIKIEMTQGEEFAMIDGNATDGYGAFQLDRGKYHVYIAVKAKSPKYADPYTDITGWVQAYDNVGALWYYIDVGYVQVKKGKNSWTDATDLFFVTTDEDDFGFVTGSEADYTQWGIWVFDYMAGLDAWTTGGYDLSDLAYFWEFDNRGNKLIQVRFYPM